MRETMTVRPSLAPLREYTFTARQRGTKSG